jgi:NAD(P)-dependent dehydrogenase (short-subunit alcohol dehydrogenase family)
VIGIARREPEIDFPGRFVSLDLGDARATDAILGRLANEERIDGLINNAGLLEGALAEAIDPQDLLKVLDVNLRPAVQAMQAVLPSMRSNRWGRIVNISSLTVLGAQRRSAYAAAKAGIMSFTRSWALELARDNITVNCVAPGPIETDFFRANNPVGSASEKRFIETSPVGRIGRPDDVAAAIAYFLSEDAGFVTGQTLFVDGGLSIGRLAM